LFYTQKWERFHVNAAELRGCFFVACFAGWSSMSAEICGKNSSSRSSQLTVLCGCHDSSLSSLGCATYIPRSFCGSHACMGSTCWHLRVSPDWCLLYLAHPPFKTFFALPRECPTQQPENAPAQHFLDEKPQKCTVNLLGALKSAHVIRALQERQ
jgi:hypothetical protein